MMRWPKRGRGLAEGVRLVAFGHALPDRVVPNAAIEAELGLAPGWIERRTGFTARRIAAADQATSDLAIQAGEAALGGQDRAGIGFLILATSTPDRLLPPTAPSVAHRLGLACAAVDLAGACAGFLQALPLAAAQVRASGQEVLVIAANLLSRRVDPADAGGRAIFADGAGAVLLAPSPDPAEGIVAADLGSDGAAADLIAIPAGGSRRPYGPDLSTADTRMQMPDGARVFQAAVERLAQSGKVALDRAGLSPQDLAGWAPHQANERIVRAAAERLGLAQVPRIGGLEPYGNTSAATIPTALSLAAARGALPRGPILMQAFGAGALWASIVWRHGTGK